MPCYSDQNSAVVCVLIGTTRETVNYSAFHTFNVMDFVPNSVRRAFLCFAGL